VAAAPMTCNLNPIAKILSFLYMIRRMEDYMKLFSAFFATVLAIALAGTAWSQTANMGGRVGTIPGYLDLRTNSFRPIHSQPTVSPSSVAATTGTIVTTFTITVASAIPATTPITCYVAASVIEVNSITFEVSNEIVDSATVLASRSAGTAKCTVTIPYSWFLLTPGSDQASLGYNISASTAITKLTKAGALINRDSLQTFDIISVPADGTTTTEAVQATL
jgi:hypothetical protein